MKAPGVAPSEPSQAHLAVVTGDVRGIAEERAVTGFLAACRTMGFTIRSGPSRGPADGVALTVVFTGSADDLGAMDPEAIVFPFVRSQAELTRWRERLGDHLVWTASTDLAASLDDGRSRVTPIGVCHASDAPDHRSRRAFALRENDVVFGCRADDYAGAEERILRAAISACAAEASRSFARVSYAIDLGDLGEEQRTAWRDWARAQPDDGIVLLERLDTASSIALVDLCDHWIVLRDTAWFPWWSTFASSRGKTTLVLDHDAPPRPDEPASACRIERRSADTALAAHMARLAGAAATATPASPTHTSNAPHSARTVGCRIVAALRHAGLWERLLWCKVR